MISNIIIRLAEKINLPAKDEKHPIDTQAREQVWNLSIFQFPLFCDSVFYLPMYIGHCQDLLENNSTFNSKTSHYLLYYYLTYWWFTCQSNFTLPQRKIDECSSWSKIAFEGVTKGLGDIAGRKESCITHGTRQATTETLVEEGWCHISLGTKQNATAASIMITSCNTIPEGVLRIMAYTGRLRPKGVPFLGSLKLWKGREICHFGRYKGRKGLTDESYGCEKVEKTVWFCNLFIF